MNKGFHWTYLETEEGRGQGAHMEKGKERDLLVTLKLKHLFKVKVKKFKRQH